MTTSMSDCITFFDFITMFQSPTFHFARLPEFGGVHVFLCETAPHTHNGVSDANSRVMQGAQVHSQSDPPV